MSVLPTSRESALEGQPVLPESGHKWDGAWPQSPQQFEKLVDAYQAPLVRYAYGRVRDHQDAEDVVQEVFVRAYKDRSKRRATRAVRSYLYRMVANACTDLLRRRKRDSVSHEKIDLEDISSNDEDASGLTAAIDELRRAEELLSRLPEAQAEVIRLRVFDGLSLKEIAEVLGRSVNTVCSRLRYGFRKLRQNLHEEETEP